MPKVPEVDLDLQAKLGSIAVHAEEMLEDPNGHAFDVAAITALLGDPDVQEWLGALRDLALIPVKRTER